MKPGIIYRGEFKNAQFDIADNSPLEQTVIVSLLDTETLIDDDATASVVPLQPGESPLNFSAIDNDEDVFHPVRGKQCEFLIHSGEGIDISTFAGGGDKRWRCELAINDVTKPFWIGFLNVDGNKQDFMPDPDEILLYADDGLGNLGDINFSEVDNSLQMGPHRIADYLTKVLAKTGLNLELWVVNNVREESSRVINSANFLLGTNFLVNGYHGDFFYVGQKIKIYHAGANDGVGVITVTAVVDLISGTQVTTDVAAFLEAGTFAGATFIDYEWHFYDKTFLEAFTFEDLDCLSALKVILSEWCYLEQYKGRWYIKSEDEFDGNTIHVAIFDEDGALDHWQHVAPDFFDKNIGAALDLSFMNDDAIISLERQLAFVKETFNYKTSKEPLCNIDFDRGDFIGDLPNELDENGNTAHVKKYVTDCWTYEKFNAANDSDEYTKRLFNENDYEIQRFVHMTSTPATTNNDDFYYLRAEKIPIHVKDKFSLGADFRFSANFSGSAINTFWIRLYGDDGSYWNYQHDGLGKIWKLSNAAWSVNREFAYWDGTSDTMTDWQNASFTSKPCPVSGKLEILLLNALHFGFAQTKNFANVQFTYIPFINGSYKKYTGQWQKIWQAINTKANRDKEVFISDSPKKYFKGALLKWNGIDYVLTGMWGMWHAAPDLQNESMHPYGETQVKIVWNQFRRIMRKFEAMIDGLQTNLVDGDGLPDIPSMVHAYKIRDVNPNTTDGADKVKTFQLLHFEQDFYLCAWKVLLRETLDTIEGKVYDDDREFKYKTTEA